MGWSERHAWFERLIELRDGYAESDDRIGILSIADAIRYGEAAMAVFDSEIDRWLADLDMAVADEAAANEPSSPLARQRRFASDLWPWPGPSAVRPADDGSADGIPG